MASCIHADVKISEEMARPTDLTMTFYTPVIFYLFIFLFKKTFFALLGHWVSESDFYCTFFLANKKASLVTLYIGNLIYESIISDLY